MKLYLLVAVVVTILAIGCSVADDLSTRFPSNDSDNDSSTADSGTSSPDSGTSTSGPDSGTTSGTTTGGQTVEATPQPALIALVGAEPL